MFRAPRVPGAAIPGTIAAKNTGNGNIKGCLALVVFSLPMRHAFNDLGCCANRLVHLACI